MFELHYFANDTACFFFDYVLYFYNMVCVFRLLCLVCFDLPQAFWFNDF